MRMMLLQMVGPVPHHENAVEVLFPFGGMIAGG
jgi:hypothetical protein